MNYKRISTDDVAQIVADNRTMGEEALQAYAAVGIAGGPMPTPPADPERPWTIRFREKHEKNEGQESGWCVHPKLRFKYPQTAAKAAQDLVKLDPRLEVQVDKTC